MNPEASAPVSDTLSLTVGVVVVVVVVVVESVKSGAD